MLLDATNLAIIRLLKDGRMPFRQIAEKLHLAENTVRARVRRLTQAGVLTVTGLVDPESIPDTQMVMIGVKIENMNLVGKAEEFSRLKGVISVSVVTGKFDLILMVMLKKPFGLLEFYTQEAATIKQIRSVETFIIYKSFNLKVPLVD
ncbi:MAG: transcriptional regulator [Desulfobulbus propionicus]|nr:MAG: transcriptional regulator [Desulfobulbus propionicus]